MCELLGMSFDEPVSPTFSFRGFSRRGVYNPHGWGIALYPGGDGASLIIKEPANICRSDMAEFVKRSPGFYSRIFISHVRRKSRGKIAYCDTHPFSRELNGRDYCFAHNGTLYEPYEKHLPPGRFKSVGNTDSEYAFCHLMSFIENSIRDWDENAFSLLYDKFGEINTLGDFNCLFSDGEYLFCYHDRNGYNGLHYLRREPPYARVKLLDEDFEIDLNDEKEPGQEGYVIASAPLTNEAWVSFEPGGFMVFRRGNICYSRSAISGTEKVVLRAIRTAPHKVSIGQLAASLNMPESNVILCIKSLKSKGYIRQDSTDSAAPLDISANYYTVADRRKEIDRIIFGK